jgi:hypothetical protein
LAWDATKLGDDYRFDLYRVPGLPEFKIERVLPGPTVTVGIVK